jgi:hypothetical protein
MLQVVNYHIQKHFVFPDFVEQSLIFQLRHFQSVFDFYAALPPHLTVTELSLSPFVAVALQ